MRHILPPQLGQGYASEDGRCETRASDRQQVNTDQIAHTNGHLPSVQQARNRTSTKTDRMRPGTVDRPTQALEWTMRSAMLVLIRAGVDPSR